MRRNIDRALAAKRESRRVEFKPAFDEGSAADWSEVIHHIVAMANSGGGVILLGVDQSGNPTGEEAHLDASEIAERLRSEIESPFSDFDIIPAAKGDKPVLAIDVGEARTPLVFSDGSSDRGRIYFRHGSKSVPGTTEDLAAAIEKRMNMMRRRWLDAVKRVVQSERPVTVLPSHVRDSDSPDATPIRVVDDPNAPAYRLVDYDKTHPYRQKELIAAFRERVPGRDVNQFDLVAIRHKHGIDDRPEFSHKPVFGSRQYSEEFLNWLVEQAQKDGAFFEDAREHLKAERSRRDR
jgi:hypothetical protein